MYTKISIKRMLYPVTTLGPGNRVVIWMTGCEKKCRECMSPELRSAESGRDISISQIMDMICDIDGEIDGVTISGGEPFLQPKELAIFVKEIRSKITEDIIVYSGYTIDELLKKEKDKDAIASVLSDISVLIDGEYLPEKNDGIGIRGSSNQKIHIFREHSKYENLDTCERNVQSISFNGNVLLVGI